MRYFDDVKYNIGYYYVNEKFNVKDFEFLFIFIPFFITLFMLKLFLPSEYTHTTFYLLICIAFLCPFPIYFIFKLLTILMFKSQKNNIIRKGQSYSAEIIDSKKGKLLYKNEYIYKKKYSYFPIIKLYKNGEYHTYTSTFAVSNSEENALSSKNITVYLYENKFIITEFKEIRKEDLSSEDIDTIDKRNMILLLCSTIPILIIYIIKFVLRFSLR